MLTTEQIIDCAVDSMYAIAALVRDDVRVVELRAAVFAFARAVEAAAYDAAIKACNNERVDAESTGAKEDYAYNAAIQHCADAIRSEKERNK